MGSSMTNRTWDMCASDKELTRRLACTTQALMMPWVLLLQHRRWLDFRCECQLRFWSLLGWLVWLVALRRGPIVLLRQGSLQLCNPALGYIVILVQQSYRSVSPSEEEALKLCFLSIWIDMMWYRWQLISNVAHAYLGTRHGRHEWFIQEY